MSNPEVALVQLGIFIFLIMLGFPICFTLMALGVGFGYYAYATPDQMQHIFSNRIFDLLVNQTYSVMVNDVLVAIPLFLFMGYVVERANIIDRLFYSMSIAAHKVPGSLAVASLATCALFATATGIVGAVVTLMGLLAFPAMLKAGYNVKVAAGAITAGGCLGILIPPSVLLIVYGAVAGVSVVQLYAGAFFPGLMLAGLYLAYVIVLAKWKPELMPPLPENERRVALPPLAQRLAPQHRNALAGLWRALGGGAGVAKHTVLGQFFVALLPALVIAAALGITYQATTAPVIEASTAGLVEAGGLVAAPLEEESTGLIGAPEAEQEDSGVKEPPAEDVKELAPPAGAEAAQPEVVEKAAVAEPERLPAPTWFWIVCGIAIAMLTIRYRRLNWERLEIFKMMLTSFFPLAVLILAVLGSIVFGLATPTEAAAVGAFGGCLLAVAYRFTAHWQAANPNRRNIGAMIWSTAKELGAIVKDSSFLTAKTSAMVCWLFVGSAIFSAAFALLGGQDIIEKWVLSLDMSPVQFMVLAQFIIFILGWPLEWTEIIVIFMPIFIPLLKHFSIDPLFFGLIVALNLQTAFLSPPVAMAAFYLKGVSPSHVTLNQIFAGMMPFMGIQVIALILLYTFPQIGLWLPQVF